jgi:hypothetical protein
MTIEGAPLLKPEHLSVSIALINVVRKVKDISMLMVILK